MPWYFYNNRGILKQEGVTDDIPIGLMTSIVSDQPVPPIPSGWLLCDGSLKTTATYPKLAAILAYPAAPGASFNLPNLDGKIPVGTSGSYPIRTTGGNNQHPHTIAGHTHSNDHTHNVTDAHQHSASHKHSFDGSSHAHNNGTYSLAAETGSTILVYETAGGSTKIVKGPGASPSHNHGVGGITGQPDGPVDTGPPNIVNSTSYLSPYTSTNVASGATDARTALLQSSASVISPVVDVLPPYLNMYYIIKAVDLSGTYL